jgi:hypothetical protein
VKNKSDNKDNADLRKDSDMRKEIDDALPILNSRRGYIDKDIKIAKGGNRINQTHKTDGSDSGTCYNSYKDFFIAADKFDLIIIKEILKDPHIDTLEISLKLGIPFSVVHKKRRLIESKLLHAKYIIDFQKLGLCFRFADVFADFSSDKVNDFTNQLFSSPFSSNVLKVVKTKTQSKEKICIKAIYQNSGELFFLMDKVKSFPFVSNVHFSEQVEVIRDNTLNVILNILDIDYK